MLESRQPWVCRLLRVLASRVRTTVHRIRQETGSAVTHRYVSVVQPEYGHHPPQRIRLASRRATGRFQTHSLCCFAISLPYGCLDKIPTRYRPHRYRLTWTCPPLHLNASAGKRHKPGVRPLAPFNLPIPLIPPYKKHFCRPAPACRQPGGIPVRYAMLPPPPACSRRRPVPGAVPHARLVHAFYSVITQLYHKLIL